MAEECVKCGFKGRTATKFGLSFCNVCIKFCPNNPDAVDKYAEEPVDAEALNPFRKYSEFRGIEQKKGMIKKASDGNAVSRAPFGYKIQNKQLIPAENFKEVEEIFEKFLEDKMTLNKLATLHNFSVNGLKKVLTNFAYVGKIKFNNEVYDGNHKPIIDAVLFNKVQDKFEKISKK